MAFIAGTSVLTNNGWKNIEDISGHDKVLVRNFLGEAEFIQPFALKKKQYDGEIISIGNVHSKISVTYNHKILYEQYGVSKTVDASEFIIKIDNRLLRKFRYNPEDRTSEKINIKNDNATRTVHISAEHWYVILVYTLFKGYISKDKRPTLKYLLQNQEQVDILTNIFDLYGINWNRTSNFIGSPIITVNRNSNLTQKLKNNLGSRARRSMKIPKKIIYGSNKYLTRIFVDTIKLLTGKKYKNCHKFRTINIKLAEDLKMLCMFGGYEVKYYNSPGFNNSASNIVVISENPDMLSVSYKESKNYSGSVYEIDLFDGQIYIKNGSAPVWMNPK